MDLALCFEPLVPFHIKDVRFVKMLIMITSLFLKKDTGLESTMLDFPKKTLFFPSILLPDGNVVFFLPNERPMSIENNHILTGLVKGRVALRENTLSSPGRIKSFGKYSRLVCFVINR